MEPKSHAKLLLAHGEANLARRMYEQTDEHRKRAGTYISG